jgi:hypothetical protein
VEAIALERLLFGASNGDGWLLQSFAPVGFPLHNIDWCADSQGCSLPNRCLGFCDFFSPMNRPFHFTTLVATALVLTLALCSCCKGKSPSEIKKEFGERGITNKLAAIIAAGEPGSSQELNKRYAEPPASENAAELYTQAFEALTPSQSSAEAKTPAFLARNQKALALLLQAADRKSCRYPIDLGEGFSVKMPHLAQIKKCGLLLESEAVSQAAQGRTDAAARAVMAGLNLARSLENEPLLISRLVETIGLTSAAQGLEQSLSRQAFTGPQLQSLQTAFQDAESASSFLLPLFGERAMFISALRLPTAELADTLKQFDQNNQLGADVIVYLKSPTYPQDVNFALDYFSNLLAVAKMPFPQCLSPEAQSTIPDIQTAIDSHYTLSATFLPALGNLLLRGGEAAARVRVAQISLAIERYRLKNANTLPNALKDLAPAFIDTVPVDPFDGQPIRYNKLLGKTQLDVTFTMQR